MDTFEKTLLNFLLAKDLQVAVIKGEWGVGKTFFWQKFFKKNKSKLKFAAYSYVSLFGLCDASNLMSDILSRSEWDDDKSLKTIRAKGTNLLAKGSRLLNFDINGFNPSTLFKYFENWAINNFLVCFDDLERMEKDISISSIFGAITRLKEEKHCKIILIFNEDKIADKKSEIDKYREKVVDTELSYKPTISDNLELIWPNGVPDGVSDLFHSLKINNIRVMQKIKSAQNDFQKPLTSYPLLITFFYRKISILSIVYYVYHEKILLDEISDMSSYYAGLVDGEEKKEIYEFLSKLQYFPEDFDKMIIDYLINGYVDFDSYQQLLENCNHKYRKRNVNETLSEIWRQYHDNFSINQKTFIETMKSFIMSNADDLNVNEIAIAETFLKNLDPSIDFKDLIESAADRYASEIEEISPFNYDFMRMLPEVKNLIGEKIAEKPQNRPILKTMIDLAGRDDWNPGDIRYLLTHSEDDFYKWITTEPDERVTRLIEKALGRFNSEPNGEEVIKRIKGALERIKQRSMLDRLRVENFCEKKK